MVGEWSNCFLSLKHLSHYVTWGYGGSYVTRFCHFHVEWSPLFLGVGIVMSGWRSLKCLFFLHLRGWPQQLQPSYISYTQWHPMTRLPEIDRKLTSNQETSTTTKTQHCTRFSGAGPISGWHSFLGDQEVGTLRKTCSNLVVLGWALGQKVGRTWASLAGDSSMEHQPFEWIDRDYVVLTFGDP